MSQTSELSGLRILLVEDEVMVAWMLEDMLGQLGCAVVGPAAHVDQALALIDTADLDAAVLDVNLNGEKSYPVADALASRGVPFVFSTGYDRKGLHGPYLGRPLLQKPFKRSTLGDALGTLLIEGGREPTETRMAPAVWDTKRLRIATDAAGVALWSSNVDTDTISMDERAHGLWGVPIGPVTFRDLSKNIHPEDLDRVRAAFASTREITGAYEVEFRILNGKDVRWVSARGRGDNQGIVGRLMFGVFLDVTERKMAEEAREMIAGEMGHRVKNLFSIASALAMISQRSTTTSKEMSRDLRLRLQALNRAHDLVRPVLGDPKGPLTFSTFSPICWPPTLATDRAATASGSSYRNCSSARPQLRLWPSSSTNWRPTRLSTEPCHRRAVRSIFPVWPTTGRR